MSVSDYRKLVDIHGGTFIGVECSDGVTIELGINGDLPVKMSAQVAVAVCAKLRERMQATLQDGFKTFEFGFDGGSLVNLNYFDGGLVLDAIMGCVRFLE